MNKVRNIFITIFVIVWCLVFHYESVRYFYLNPLFNRTLPKVKFLFPPAGWIMFYRVGESFGYVDIFGFKDGNPHEIDPHEIFGVRTIGFDNIHRGVVSSAASNRNYPKFCDHLERRFPHFENFAVTYTSYPNFVTEPNKRLQRVLYDCSK